MHNPEVQIGNRGLGGKMNRKRLLVGRHGTFTGIARLGVMGVLVLVAAALAFAQAQPSAAPSGPVRLDVADGSTASYRVQEQLAGINFPSDAVGTTSALTGTLALNADGSVNSAQSKLTIDLRTLNSDQEMRDGYIQKRTLETDKFPLAEFVPKRVQGLAWPLPTTGQTGFQLTGDMTIHGVTSEITWTGVATFGRDNSIAGRATTSFTFATFGLMKPKLARVLSVDDKIQLEVAFHFKRS
jgi:polyisoprenoid-binding protein YceI